MKKYQQSDETLQAALSAKVMGLLSEEEMADKLQSLGYVFIKDGDNGEWVHKRDIPTPGSQPYRPSGVRNDVTLIVKSWDRQLVEELTAQLAITLERDPRYEGYEFAGSPTDPMPNAHDSGYRAYINLDCPELDERFDY